MQFDLVLLRNNQELKRTASDGGTVTEDFRDKSFDQSVNYYLGVVEHDGEFAWSGPIRVNG